MKVILMADVKGSGKCGDVINVSDGYARNFLFPKNLAKQANASNLNILDSQKKALEHKKDTEKSQAEALKEKIEALSVSVHAKSGENGKLFGSVTTMDIADVLKKEHKIDVDKRKIVVDEAFKHIGSYTVEVKLYPNVTANLKVNIQ